MKTILNTTTHALNELQLDGLAEADIGDYKWFYAKEPLKYQDDNNNHINPRSATDFTSKLVAEIDAMETRPRFVVLDVPRKVIPYIEALFHETDIQCLYIVPGPVDVAGKILVVSDIKVYHWHEINVRPKTNK